MHERTVRVVDGDGDVLGVAFAVAVLDSARTGTFLLSAGHALWSHHRQSHLVRLVTRDGGAVEGVRTLACATPDDDVDVALLYADDLALAPLTCVLDAPERGTPVVVRGAPAGVGTLFANFRGVIHGEETLGTLSMLDVALDDLTVLDPPPLDPAGRDRITASPSFRALRGLSGAPVVEHVAGHGLTTVCGLVSRRNSHGIANRVHAVRMADVRHVLAEAGHVLLAERSSASVRPALLQGLLGEAFVEAASSPEREHVLWERLSSEFYAGRPVDDLLLDMAGEPARYGIADELSLCFLDHFCARLLAKAGREPEAAHFRRRAVARASLHGNDAYARIAALTALRAAAEHHGGQDAVESVSAFGAAAGRYEDLDAVPDPYKAYELASATGRLALELLRLVPAVGGPEVRRLVDDLTARHAAYVGAYPDVLVEKQEIVQLGLAGVQLAADALSGRGDRDELMALCRRGRTAAAQRKNAIFHAQMLLLEALVLWHGSRREEALASTIVVMTMLRSASLTVRHEGIAQIHLLARQDSPVIGRTMDLVSRHGPGPSLARLTHPTSDAVPAMVRQRAVRTASERIGELDGLAALLGVETDDYL